MPAGAPAAASGDLPAALATAATLNAFLGTRHTKSWMTATSAASAASSNSMPKPAPAPPARKRGRPRKYPPPEIVDLPHAPDSARFPSSNSTSPQLANVVTNVNRAAHSSHAHVVVLPSPAPSEEDVPGPEVHNEPEPWPTVNAHRDPPLQSASASMPPQTAVANDPVMHHVLSSKRRAGANQTPVDKRPRFELPSQHTPSPATTNSPLDFYPLPQFPQQPLSPSTQQETSSVHQEPGPRPLISQAQPVQVAQHQNRPQALRSDWVPMHGHTAPAQTVHWQVGHGQAAPGPSRQSPQQILVSLPLQNQPLRVPSNAQPAVHHLEDWYSVRFCMQTLEPFRANCHPQSSLDHRRLIALHEAVQLGDWAYLTLHQHYCVMTRHVQSLPRDLQRNPNINPAFELMRRVLEDNQYLAPPFLDFFCRFPLPIGDLESKWPARYKEVKREFVAFVDYSPMAVALLSDCEARRVPPTPREMAQCAIHSPTFQRHLFYNIVSSLLKHYPRGSARDALQNQVSQAFTNAQTIFDQQRRDNQLGGEQQAREDWIAWAQYFTHLTQPFEVQRRRQGFRPAGTAWPHQPHQPYPSQLSHLRQQQQQQQRQPQILPQSLPPAYNLPRNPQTPGDMAMSYRRQPQPPQAIHSRTASQSQPSPRARQNSTALLPRPGVLQPHQRVPVPHRYGLHQAALRSPLLQAVSPSSPYHYFWQAFKIKPTRVLNANNAIEELSFVMTKEDVELIAKALPTASGAADSRGIHEHHKTFRLRCVKWTSAEEPTATAWAIAENRWIPFSYFTFNNTCLQQRKKLYHGKDLPIDLTGLVREGRNVLEVSSMNDALDTTHRAYLIAIEVLGVMTQASIKTHCYENKIPAEKTIAEFKRRLSSGTTSLDDDILVVESTLTINLRDPFSASKICDTPVRGTACLHNECFDLDTFLSTRPRKASVSVPDQWRCPICKADARPTVLVVDEFLINVRSELAARNLLDTRAIVVDQDGVWTPKLEERGGVRDSESPDPQRAPHAPAAAARSLSNSAMLVIDLDSD